MYSVEIRDHVMVAHSLAGEVFGPAQRLHGATFVADVTFLRPTLDENDIVVDIGLASEVLRQVLSEINYRNLDEHPAFAGRRSTSEVLARWLFDQVAAAIQEGRLGPGAKGITRLKVTLHESHVARAGFEADLAHA